MASERPEYQKKVIALSALAPAAFMSRTGISLFQMLCFVANDNVWFKISNFNITNHCWSLLLKYS